MYLARAFSELLTVGSDTDGEVTPGDMGPLRASGSSFSPVRKISKRLNQAR
jgi:hypothetical protein